ncbi:CBM96 family carbohydrate-binding protein [Paenibacillus arenilitoris]|uniref:DNRLRE domain-containing protein n=1 Tax=Paenibacillus arenilitoris TaxID=2772299 RepID=A0A927CGC1_9BACL|nr:DNRLRE domain-containing protein [Paenibacillus arenilitoris]MBD2866964.1 DNRLRE domain-containing protein [Paenibacillus arenilitoris]
MSLRVIRRTAIVLVLTLIGQLLIELAAPIAPVAMAAEQRYTVYTSKDGFVRRSNPSSPVPDYSSMPYGGEAAKTGYLQVKESNTTSPREAYLQFDLSDYPEQISSATLYFHANNGENNTATVETSVYGIHASAGNDWEESTLTWNNKPDKGGGSIGTVTIPGGTNKGWVSLDVTSFIQERQADDKIATFAVAGGNALIRIESSTTYLNDSNGKPAKPYMVIQGTPALKSVELTADKTSLGLHQTANLSVKGTMDTNSPADLSRATLHYSSDNPAIAFSDPSIGTATAAGEGTANVKVEVTLDGVTRTAVRTLTVDGTPPAEVAEIQDGIDNGEFTLTWTDPSDEDLENVSVYNGDQLLGTVPKGEQSLIIAGLTNGQTYSLTIRTMDSAGNESSGVVHSIEYEQPNVLMEVAATASQPAVRTGRTVTVTVSGVMSDGTTADLDGAAILYESSSNRLVFADSSSHVAEAMFAGPAYVTARVTLDGVTRQSAPVLVRVLSEVGDEFDRLRNKYAAKFTGYDPDDPYDLSDPYISSYIQSQDELAKGYWNALNKTAYGWDDLTSTTATAQLSTLTSRLRTMSRQWASYGSVYYQNESLLHDIIETWNTFYDTRYNETMAKFGNWFDLQVHVPNNFHDSISAIYEAVPFSEHPDLVEKMHRAIDHFVPSIGLTGANRVYLSKVMILRGIIGKDGDKIQEGSGGLSAVFRYVQDGDGFYEDGSFIQHSYFPYAGGYGKALLHDLSETLWLVSGSQWDNDDPQKANIFEWFADTFEPNMFNGHLIDAVNGREVSRTSVYSGNSVLGGLLLQLELDGNPNAQQQKSAIEYHLEQGNAALFMASSPIWYIQKAKQLMNDAAIPPYAEPQGNYLFHNQDNVVHRGVNWLYSIGMHS